MMDIACVQTSPISFVARGKEPFSACNKGNRRRLHAGNDGDGFINLKKKKLGQESTDFLVAISLMARWFGGEMKNMTKVHPYL